MHPKLHHFLYAFFIQGLDLDRIAAMYETSWHEVTKALDSEPARELMRSALRIERLRAAAENLAGRRIALRTLGAVANSLDQTPTGYQSRRRAATAILSGTRPGRNNKPSRAAASPKPTSPLPPPSESQPEKQPAPPKRSLTPTPHRPHKPLNTPTQIPTRKPAHASAPKPTTKPTTKPTPTPTRSARSARQPSRPSQRGNGPFSRSITNQSPSQHSNQKSSPTSQPNSS